MKIFTLPVDSRLQPASSPMIYPPHGRDHGIEQDFLLFLKNNPGFLTTDPRTADFHYLPVYWTRWHLWHDYAKNGLEELTKLVNVAMVDAKKTFTVCQYDDGPVINLENTIQFLASRKTETGIDVPLLCVPHRLPWLKPKKKLKASFIGRLSTHEIRGQMADQLKKRSDVFISDGSNGTRHFVKHTLQSYVSLSPRGYGGSSFRFFEAMQLGIVPYLIGEPDTRPFKRFISWDTMSLYSREASDLNSTLDGITNDELLRLGEKAKRFWHSHFIDHKWCHFMIRELEEYL